MPRGESGLRITWEGAVGLIVRKTITLLVVLLLVLTVEFLFLRVGIGVEYYIPKGASPESTESVRETLHVDESPLVQYFYFIGDMLTGKGSFDLYSYTAHRPVADVIDDSFWNTLLLFGTTLVLSLLLGLLAAYALWRMTSRKGRAVGGAVLLLLWTVPVVLVALLFLLQVVFRFDISWAFHEPVDYSSMDWFERLLYHIKQRIFPILILTLCSFGGFSLMALQGFRRVTQTQPTAAKDGGLKRPSFSKCIVSVMPNMKLNIAFIMSCVLVIEVFWILDGLGYRVQIGMFNLDLAIVDASMFLILLIVLVSGFILDLSLSLIALRSPHAAPGAAQIAGQEESVEPSSGRAHTPQSGGLLGELSWFGSEYKRSVPGIVGGVMLVAVAVLALVGPIVGDRPDIGQPFVETDPVDQFLIGARDPFLLTLAVLALSFVIGFFAGLLTLPLGKFNYPVVLVAETFIVIPILGMFFMVWLAQYGWMGIGSSFWRLVLSTALVTWAPVALVVLGRAKDVDSAYGAESSTEKGVARYGGLLTAGTRITMPDAVAALKYVAVVGSLSILAFEYSLYGSGDEATWGSMIHHYMQYQMARGDIEFNLWWILPLVGVVVMVSGFYLVLQAAQDVIEKRMHLARQASPPPPSAP